MIERKIDNDTIMIGREVKISDLEARKVELEATQIASQPDRDKYEEQSEDIKEKMILPIDFAPEIEEVDRRITAYKAAKVGKIEEPKPPKDFEALKK